MGPNKVIKNNFLSTMQKIYLKNQQKVNTFIIISFQNINKMIPALCEKWLFLGKFVFPGIRYR